MSIARVKNGFTKSEGYRDIKVNVVFLSVQVCSASHRLIQNIQTLTP